jgi:hypothetical protein
VGGGFEAFVFPYDRACGVSSVTDGLETGGAEHCRKGNATLQSPPFLIERRRDSSAPRATSHFIL